MNESKKEVKTMLKEWKQHSSKRMQCKRKRCLSQRVIHRNCVVEIESHQQNHHHLQLENQNNKNSILDMFFQSPLNSFQETTEVKTLGIHWDFNRVICCRATHTQYSPLVVFIVLSFLPVLSCPSFIVVVIM